MSNRKKQRRESQVKEFAPLNFEQEEYLTDIKENIIVVCTGRSGSGKTSCAIAAGIQGVRSGNFDRIIVTKPIITVSDKDLGILPGSVWQKIEPFFQNIIDELIKQLGKDEYYNMLRDGKIKYTPIEFMRGATLDNSFVLLDEAQNTSFMQMKTVLTRIGQNSKIVINGDMKQSDLQKTSGLTIIVDKLQDVDGISFIHLQQIVRNDIISKILERLEQ